MAIAGGFLLPHPPIIFPEIGRGEEKKINDTINAYRRAAKRIAAMQPETIVIISPHTVMYKDYFHISPDSFAEGDFSRFGCPELKLQTDYDEEFVTVLEGIAYAGELPAGTEGERDKALDHGTMIPLRFIKEAYRKPFKIVRIGISGLPLKEHYRLGAYIREASEQLDRRLVIIASGDLSHRLLEEGPYGYAAEGPVYDKRITEILAEGKFGRILDFTEDFRQQAAECGHGAIAVMTGSLDGIALHTELLSYEGSFGVGYAIAAFRDKIGRAHV